jgi:hypothetical protein
MAHILRSELSPVILFEREYLYVAGVFFVPATLSNGYIGE